MARSAITSRGLSRIEGVPEAQAKVEKLLTRLSAQGLKDEFMVAGRALRDRIKANARYNPKRKQGFHLRDAVFAAPGKPTEPNVLVGVSRSRRKTGKPAAPHGLLLEYGTVKMPARPFFRPALTAMRAEVARLIGNGIKKAVEQFA